MRNLLPLIFLGILIPAWTDCSAAPLAISHAYDELNRLTRTAYTLRGREIASSTYQYDPAGNINDVQVVMNLYEGDVNGDNHVDLVDLISALQIVSAISGSAPDLEADVDGDTRIGMQEAVFILQEIGSLRRE